MKFSAIVIGGLSGVLALGLFGDRTGVPLCALAAQHEGQPATCNNYTENKKPCACHRATECPETGPDGVPVPRGEDPKCQVYCRPDACKCISPCDS